MRKAYVDYEDTHIIRNSIFESIKRTIRAKQMAASVGIVTLVADRSEVVNTSGKAQLEEVSNNRSIFVRLVD